MISIISKLKNAKIKYMEGHLGESIMILENILESQSLNFEANANLAFIYYEQKDYTKSSIYAINAFKSNGSDEENFIILSNSLLNMGKENEAIKCFEEYKSKNSVSKKVFDIYKELIVKNDNLQTRISKEPKVKILFIQQYAGIRCYKYAKALRGKGHDVSLLYGNSTPGQAYKNLDDSIFSELHKYESIVDLWDYCKRFDLIHCHNEPDFLTVAALMCDKPVIHDTADLISLRDIDNPNTFFYEALANKGVIGRIYSTKYQRDKATELYRLTSSSLIFENYISEGDRPKEFLNKLSKKDNNFHIVYQGSISKVKHRDFTNIFDSIAKGNITLHIYPTKFDNELYDFFSKNKNINYYQPISPREIMTEMSQYDIGIIPWNLEMGQKDFLDTTIANKLFEYLASGLPVITSNVKSYADYFSLNKVGSIFNSIDEVPKLVKELLLKTNSEDLVKYAPSFEDKIDDLLYFYAQVLNEYQQNCNFNAEYVNSLFE